jgi:hypothetical protein
VAIEKLGGEVVVAVAEDGGGDGDEIAEDAAGGVASAVDLGGDGFNDDAVAAGGWFHSGSLSRSLTKISLSKKIRFGL